MKTALLAGATGLIGKQLLGLLLDDDRYVKVKAISRKPITFLHRKLENIVLDFDSLSEMAPRLDANDIFCCIGTTMKQAGSKSAFRKVDYEYPLEIARISKEQGAEQYFLVSAIGANKSSSIFYNKVKGEVEGAIEEIGFNSFHVFRPSLLIGDRDEKRGGEDAAKTFYKFFNFLIPLKYKAIESLKVANAMLYFAQQEQQGIYIHESKELQQF